MFNKNELKSSRRHWKRIFFFQFSENGGNADHAPCRGAEGEKNKLNSWEAAG